MQSALKISCGIQKLKTPLKMKPDKFSPPKSDLNRFHAQEVSKHNSDLNRFHAQEMSKHNSDGNRFHAQEMSKRNGDGNRFHAQDVSQHNSDGKRQPCTNNFLHSQKQVPQLLLLRALKTRQIGDLLQKLISGLYTALINDADILEVAPLYKHGSTGLPG